MVADPKLERRGPEVRPPHVERPSRVHAHARRARLHVAKLHAEASCLGHVHRLLERHGTEGEGIAALEQVGRELGEAALAVELEGAAARHLTAVEGPEARPHAKAPLEVEDRTRLVHHGEGEAVHAGRAETSRRRGHVAAPLVQLEVERLAIPGKPRDRVACHEGAARVREVLDEVEGGRTEGLVGGIERVGRPVCGTGRLARRAIPTPDHVPIILVRPDGPVANLEEVPLGRGDAPGGLLGHHGLEPLLGLGRPGQLTHGKRLGHARERRRHLAQLGEPPLGREHLAAGRPEAREHLGHHGRRIGLREGNDAQVAGLAHHELGALRASPALEGALLHEVRRDAQRAGGVHEGHHLVRYARRGRVGFARAVALVHARKLAGREALLHDAHGHHDHRARPVARRLAGVGVGQALKHGAKHGLPRHVGGHRRRPIAHGCGVETQVVEVEQHVGDAAATDPAHVAHEVGRRGAVARPAERLAHRAAVAHLGRHARGKARVVAVVRLALQGVDARKRGGAQDLEGAARVAHLQKRGLLALEVRRQPLAVRVTPLANGLVEALDEAVGERLPVGAAKLANLVGVAAEEPEEPLRRDVDALGSQLPLHLGRPRQDVRTRGRGGAGEVHLV